MTHWPLELPPPPCDDPSPLEPEVAPPPPSCPCGSLAVASADDEPCESPSEEVVAPRPAPDAESPWLSPE
jgi:hypothetical protein